MGIHPLHVVQRADGTWLVEREDARIPLSLHRDREAAIDAALDVARHDHCALVVHRRPRPKARWLDRLAWRLVRQDEAGRRKAC